MSTEHLHETVAIELLDRVTHELMTPLTAIRGGAQTLARRDIALSDRRRELLLQGVEEQSQRLERALRQLLTARRLTQGELAVATTDCAPLDVVRDVVRDAATWRGPHVRMAVPDRPCRHVRTDTCLLREALSDLVHHGCSVSMATDVVLVDCHDRDGRVRFRVRHADPSARTDDERMWEPLTMVGHPPSGGRGLGLELHNARRIVALLGGRLSRTVSPPSVAGGISTATLGFTLPVNEEEARRGCTR